MSTDYNQIAQEYHKAKQQPWRAFVEAFTMTELLGDLSGKSVLDLACGEGFSSRLLQRRGAARVVGVDLSERMIDLARQQEDQAPLGIEYHVGDARTLHLGEQFDLVVAAYLLNYASTREELLQMCRTIGRSLKPGGRFVGVNNNPAQSPESFDSSRKYGFIKELGGPLGEGTPIVYRFFLGDQSFEITNYHLGIGTHEWAFHTAGLHGPCWHRPQVAPEGVRQSGRDYWAAMLDQGPIIFLECRKGMEQIAS